MSAIQNTVDTWQICIRIANGAVADIAPSSQRPRAAEIFKTASREPIMQSAVDRFGQTDDWLWKSSSISETVVSESAYWQCSSQVGKRAGCKRNRAKSSVRTTKIRAQFSEQTTQNRAQFRARMTKWGTLLRVNDQNSVTIQCSREWNEVLAQLCGGLMKTRAQIVKQLQAFLHRPSENTENTKTGITFSKKKKNNNKYKNIIFLFFLIIIIRAGRWIIGQGARQYGQGAAPS